MATIQFVNTSNFDTDTEVEAHRPDCQHVRKFKQSPYWLDADAGTMEASSSVESWMEYNADFSAEEAWPVTVFPCTNIVHKTVTISTN